MRLSYVANLPGSRLNSLKLGGRTIYIFREDLLHSNYPGNKWRKLFSFREKLLRKEKPYKKIVSFGGIHSNSMLAVAHLAKEFGLEFTYFSKKRVTSPLVQGNLKMSLDLGMTLVEDNIDSKKIILELDPSDTLVIPMGGAHFSASVGLEMLSREMEQEIQNLFSPDKNIAVILPSGTGTTAYYLKKHIKFQNVEVYTVPVVGNRQYLISQIEDLRATDPESSQKDLFPIIIEGKTSHVFASPQLEHKRIYCHMKLRGIEFDLIYAPRTWQVIFENWSFFKNREILYIHTARGMLNLVPISVLTDSYKAGHFEQYPDSNLMVAYGEFRSPYEKDTTDTRFVFYGIRYIIENYISHPWTIEDVEKAEKFYSTHNAGKTAYPYPRDLFLKFVKENHGYFPIKIEALPEGTVANIHVPVYQLTTTGEYAKLITFLETILTHVWYPTTVATLSRRTKDIIEYAFDRTVDDDLRWLLDSRLHDFGFRGCTCVEQSIIGGSAHLLNFSGTDTMSAAYYAQFHLNGGKPVAESIPATEHFVMTSWPTEGDAIRQMIRKFGGEGKIFACVMDSYNYENALTVVLPSIIDEKNKKGGIMVLRPDSGDPVQVVLLALREADKLVGSIVNKKGFKILKGLNVVQGDGINYKSLKEIVDAVIGAGFSATNVAYGMGGGLLQKLNRDTMSFATKLSHIQYADGTSRDVMKKPKSDIEKISLPGILKVKKVNGIPTIFPSTEKEKDPENLLKVVWDYGPVKDLVWDDFSTVRNRVSSEWYQVPKVYDPKSKELKEKIENWIKDFHTKFPKI